MRTLIPSVLVASALVGCNPKDENADPVPVQSADLSRFSTCGELQSYVADAWVEILVQSRYGYGMWAYPAEDSADGGDTSGGPADYSTTNNQEAGVDEPDIVKTDGNFVYVVQNHDAELTIVKSWPAADAAVVGRVSLGDTANGWPYAMFLDGDRAVVFSYIWSGYDENGNAESPLFRDGYATRISLIDVSDRTNPTVEREIDVEGWMTSSRLIGDDMYVVMNTSAYLPSDLWNLAWDDTLGLPEANWEGTDAEQEAIREQARAIFRPLVEQQLANIDVADLLPRQFAHLPGEEVEGEPLLDCGDIYHPEGVSRPGVLSVAHLDLGDDDGDLTATGIMADGWTVYASEDNLYVAETSWYWWWGYGDMDLSTHIHKFALDGADTVYTSSAEVDGWLWSQYALSEYDGYLRVATTDFDWWWGSGAEQDQGGNNVFVLDDDMNQVGAVTGFAPGEQIQASRFLGEQGYVITYRQVDPLFTFDLSDPTAPKIAGELSMPGFSSYLHPYGTDRLIGIGMDGNSDGTVNGFAVNLFDISDLAHPTLVDQELVSSDDWSYSEAMWDPHAFTLHRDVLNVPIYTYDYDESTGYYDGFSGMWSVGVGEDGLTDIGRVDHADLVDQSECLYKGYYGYYGETGDEVCYDTYWYAWMRRSVVVEDNLFSISDYGIKVTDLNDPTTTVAEVLFWPEAQ
jgi:hypothetical protein